MYKIYVCIIRVFITSKFEHETLWKLFQLYFQTYDTELYYTKRRKNKKIRCKYRLYNTKFQNVN